MDIKEYIYPELIIIVPVLSAIGHACKKSKLVKDKYIPLVIGTVGIVLSFLKLISEYKGGNTSEIFGLLFMSVVQGILCSSLSVYAHQIIKQKMKWE